MLACVWDNSTGRGGPAQPEGGGNLRTDETLATAVLLSWFTDRRATAAQLREFGLEGEDPRGYWGDTYPDVEGDAMGSVLWLWERAKKTARTLSALRTEARRALQWLVDDGHVTTVTVTSSDLGGDLFQLRAVLTLPDGSTLPVEAEV